MTPDLPDDDVWVLADDIAAAHHRRSIIADWHYGARRRLRIAICEALMAERRRAALSQSPDNGAPRHE